MSDGFRKVIFPLLAAVFCAAAAGAFCLFGTDPPQNASALIRFTDASESKGPVDTETSRSVSAVRRLINDRNFISSLSLSTGMSPEELKKALSVERLGNSKGVQITVSGLANSADAPIILINVLHLMEADSELPPYEVISSCDMNTPPQLPLWVCTSCGGLAGALICIVIRGFASRDRRAYYSPRKADDHGEEYFIAVSMQEYIEDALKFALELGTLPLSAPEGLEKSGYTEAAEKLKGAWKDASPAVIAIAPDFYGRGGEQVPPQAKIAAYLACAFAEKGLRTALIECCLKKPALGKLFKSADKGGISDIAAGNCAVWDALAVNARGGVDVIAEKKSYPAPTAVLASPSFGQLMDYLSGQYDVMLLYAPKAWDCEEWKLIERRCTGIIAVTEERSMLTANSARGMLAKVCKFYAVCQFPAKEIK